MAKTYLATKSEVQAVQADVQTVSTQINTATTGIEPRLQAVETNQSQVTQNTSDIAALDLQLNDATTGLVKAVTDLDTQINEAGTGVIARLDDLEQGGTATMKFRTHSPSGVYEDGEVVQKDGSLYKANSAIDGSSTAVPFARGTAGATWRAFFPDTKAALVFESVTPSVTDKSGNISYSNNSLRLKSATVGVDIVNADFANPDPEYVPPLSDFESTISFDPITHNIFHSIKETRRIDSSVVTASKTLATTDQIVTGFNDSNFTFNSDVLYPDLNNTIDFGSESKAFKGGHFQYVNFMSAANANEGNIDADAGSLGLFGTTELALGHGNNNKDLTFTSSGVTLNEDLTVKSGKSIRFVDADTSNPEIVSLRNEGNDLAFYGKLNTEAEVEVARLTYDGNLTVKGDVSGANTTKVYSIYQQVTATAANITLVDDDRVRVKFVGTNVGGSIWFEVYNKSGVSSNMIWSSITDGVSASGNLNQTDGNGLSVASPTSTSGERTISVYIVGRNGTGNGLKGVVVDIAMRWASTSFAVGVVRVSGAY